MYSYAGLRDGLQSVSGSFCFQIIYNVSYDVLGFLILLEYASIITQKGTACPFVNGYNRETYSLSARCVARNRALVTASEF
jgi:hypothetical protein